MAASPFILSDSIRKVHIFGPQLLTADTIVLRKLRSELNEAHNKWILQLTATLPLTWKSLIDRIPRLKCLDGANLLQQLHEVLQTGFNWDSKAVLPNFLLAPLTVIIHLVQFSTYLSSVDDHSIDANSTPAFALEETEVWGLCTGVLSAFVVRCSVSQTEFRKHGAAAVRLALLAAAVIDADDVRNPMESEAESISVSWLDTDGEATINRILLNFPDAYIPVRVDEKRLTVTASKVTIPALSEALKAAGLHIYEMNWVGRYHWPGRTNDMEDILHFCRSDERFQLPSVSELALGSSSKADAWYPVTDSLHELALRDILANQSNWNDRFSALRLQKLATENLSVLCFGPQRCIPISTARMFRSSLTYMSDLDSMSSISQSIPVENGISHSPTNRPDERVAVVGMSCRTAGANDLDEYWTVLANGQSQHTEVPEARFKMETPWRKPDTGRKWYGNFIQGYSQFDHRFFKKNPREAASMDPQHRLALQAAYQAIEQSGYFNAPFTDKHIGCYLGIGMVDYEQNVACHPANAYTTKGTAKAFAAGNISHHFGWTGPSMTLDTACSASGVAIHLACRSILGGECTAALAGGVNILTNPDWFYNLSGASFLSTTGQCKPFDANADGYCRGEGVGFVFLKKLSQAIADGDQVYGVIAGTRVNQSHNFTTITAPNVPSLSGSFRDVVRQTGLASRDITVVEAHGTGTPVGDPVEYDSVRIALGGSKRSDTLYLSSVKGSIGHCEIASGVLSLVKVLLMLSKGAIPPQASFNTMNPSLKTCTEDKIEIPRRMTLWKTRFRAALINNYGASGSNASMIVTQAPDHVDQRLSLLVDSMRSYPFRFSGFDDTSLRAYTSKFLQFLRYESSSLGNFNLEDVSFQLCRQSNRSLPHTLILKARTFDELQSQLSEFEKTGTKVQSKSLPLSRPVILCFGGQVSNFVGLDRTVYNSVSVFKTHLDHCNDTCISSGLDSIYPAIFQRSPIEKLVQFHCALFAIQYSCAMSWIDCGLQADAVIGHSFGELVALCIAGVFSLHDALTLVTRRATIIERWQTTDKGSMLAVEADISAVEDLLKRVRQATTSPEDPVIACYNGPRSFTLAGSTKAIQIAEKLINDNEIVSSFMAKRLNVTNAYHSALTDPLVRELEALGQSVTYNKPTIRAERATKDSTTKFDASFIADHISKPVFFHHAVQRLAQDFPSAIWLEAGSNSTITNMALRALEGPKAAHFQPINLSDAEAMENLVHSTTKLWKAGANVSHWEHHRPQAGRYRSILLPPYQFAKTEHWMELKEIPGSQDSLKEPSMRQSPLGLTTFLKYHDGSKRSVSFRVNTSADQFQEQFQAISVVQTGPMASSMLQLSIVLDGLTSLRPEFRNGSLTPEIRRMIHQNVFVLHPDTYLHLDATSTSEEKLDWQWKLSSTNLKDGISVTLTSGMLTFKASSDTELNDELDTIQRMVSRKRCIDILNDLKADEALQGPSIYRAFNSITKWSLPYRNLTRIAAKGMETAGCVKKAYTSGGWIDAVLSECFCQVADIRINLMMETCDLLAQSVFTCSKIGRWIRNPAVNASATCTDHWEVLTIHHQVSQVSFVSDTFAFNPEDGSLFEAILGVTHQQTPLDSLRKILSCATSPQMPQSVDLDNVLQIHQERYTLSPATPGAVPTAIDNNKSALGVSQAASVTPRTSSPDVLGKMSGILCNLSGLDLDGIQEESELIELGVDSLMALEVIREVEAAFHCSIPIDELLEIASLRELVTCISNKLGLPDAHSGEGERQKALPRTSEVNARTNDVDLDLETEDDYGTLYNNAFQNPSRVIDPNIDSDTTAQNTPTSSAVHNDRMSSAGGTPELSNQLFIENDDRNHLLSSSQAACFPEMMVLEAFQYVKWRTDYFVKDGNLESYLDKVGSRMTELCIVYILDAFEQLGNPIRCAVPGQQIRRVYCHSKHENQLDLLYGLLEHEARLIDITDAGIIRTAISPPLKSADVLLAELLRDEPVHASDYKLTALLGQNLASCLIGKKEGVHLLFSEGREELIHSYSKSPFMGVWVTVLEKFMGKLLEAYVPAGEPLCILEIGAGTGSATERLLPMLAVLGRPVKYMMTDLSPSLVAASRKKFKQFDFVEFKVLNIELEPEAELLDSQHIILSTNCVHATRKLSVSLGNIHRMLRNDGQLLLLELTERVPWVDFVFGLVDGWWLFEDDRKHAISSVTRWESVLHSVGYGHVDWTEGNAPETSVQRLIIAHKTAARRDRAPKPPPVLQTFPTASSLSADAAQRRAALDSYVREYTEGFAVPERSLGAVKGDGTLSERIVLVTGATGNLGAHLVAYLASCPDVRTVVCLNRLSSTEATARQYESFANKGIILDADSLSKLKIIAADSSKPMLGLSREAYDSLTHTVTHVVHSAWPMSLTRPIRGYEIQFKIFRRLLDLACDISVHRHAESKVGFLFISSIATVANYPYFMGKAAVPEEMAQTEVVPAGGYPEAKVICERMLSQTLRRHPDSFDVAVARIAQISGSTASGYWPATEYIPLMIKSSQVLRVLPDLDGTLSWCPVDKVAATIGEILASLASSTSATSFINNDDDMIYHIDNPSRQPWKHVINTFAQALGIPTAQGTKGTQGAQGTQGIPTQGIPTQGIIPYSDWLNRIRRFRTSSKPINDNPALQLMGYWERYFVPMSCGQLMLDTSKAEKRSETLRNMEVVGDELLGRYVESWKREGFLFQ